MAKIYFEKYQQQVAKKGLDEIPLTTPAEHARLQEITKPKRIEPTAWTVDATSFKRKQESTVFGDQKSSLI